MNRNLAILAQNFFTNSILKRNLASPKGGFSGGKLGGGISKKGGAAQSLKKVEVPVETDPIKLTKFCCGLNILKTGGQEVELKPDSEYPEWLWSLSLDKGPSLEDMDKNSLQYWTRKRKIALRFKNKLMKKEFPKPFIPPKLTKMRLA